MFNVVQAARAMTAACISVAVFFGMSAPAAADPTDDQANNDKLFAFLSGGYTPSDCQASKHYPQDPFLARLGCGPDSQPNGPHAATYSLYGNKADLDKTFNVYDASNPCPGTTEAGPTTWSGGRVKCGHISYPVGEYMLTWTRDADLVVVNVSGQDPTALWNWWLSAR
jgi:serine/threonine kinase PknH